MIEKMGSIPLTTAKRTVRSYVSQLYAGSFGSAGRRGRAVATRSDGPAHQRFTRTSCASVFESWANTASGSPYSTIPSSKIPTRSELDAEAVAARQSARPTAAATSAAATLRTCRVSLEGRQRTAEPFLERHLRLPAEQLPRTGDVRLANLRVVDGKRLEDDRARRSGRRR